MIKVKIAGILKRTASVAAMLMVLSFLCTAAGCDSKGTLTEVELNEVAHSIFYAPMYVAIEEGYFEEEGLKVNLTNGLGADKTMTAVVSGEADIGFMGSEASIYIYNEGADDYAVNFAQLTQRAGNFLVARNASGEKTDTSGEALPEFDWTTLKGRTVIGGRKGGMPQMVFEYILKKNGINPETDLEIIQNIDFGLTSQAFAAGTGEYSVEFEPAASSLEAEGTGTVVASLGLSSGKVPYTAYCAKKSYIEANPGVIQSFVNALQKGMDYVNSHTPEEIAKVIQPQFAETDIDRIVNIVSRYYNQQTWKTDLVFEEESFTLLQDILADAGELAERVPYELLVNTEFAEKAAK